MSKLLKVKEVAERLNCSVRQVHYMIEKHGLPAIHPTPQVLRVDESDLNAYIERSRKDAQSAT